MNKVRQIRQKCDKLEGSTRTNSHKLDKWKKPNKRQPLPKRPRYEHYTPLIANRTTILKESFNLEVPIRLPPTKPPRPGLDTTKYYRYNRDIHHNTKDCWALKDKVEELIQAGYLAHFVIRPNNHQAGAKPSGHQGEQHGNHDADKRRDKAKEWGR